MDISLFKRIKEITTYTNVAFNSDIVTEEKRLKLNVEWGIFIEDPMEEFKEEKKSLGSCGQEYKR